MGVLRPDPDLYDVEGWQARLDDLRADPQDDVTAAKIAHAEAHLAVISRLPKKSPVEAR